MSAGLLADRIGRVRMLQLTILWVAAVTFVAAFASSFSHLLEWYEAPDALRLALKSQA